MTRGRAGRRKDTEVKRKSIFLVVVLCGGSRGGPAVRCGRVTRPPRALPFVCIQVKEQGVRASRSRPIKNKCSCLLPATMLSLRRSAISTAALLLLLRPSSAASALFLHYMYGAFTFGTSGAAKVRQQSLTCSSCANSDSTPSSTTAAAAATPLRPLTYLSGISSLPRTYDTYLLDMWGVMHDGTNPYPGVLDAISHLKSQKKRLIILSNSSKRLGYATKMLSKLGFRTQDFEQIITSGEVSWRMLSGDATLECQAWSVLTDLIANSDRRVFVFGSGDNDEEYCTTAGWALAPIEEADLILARGTFTLNDGSADGVVSKKIDGEEAYFAEHDRVLKVAAERNVPMLVSNPDRVRPDKGFPPMPGAIGDAYERAVSGDGGGDVVIGETDLVRRIGKPHCEVYELALGDSTDIARTRNADTAIMIGDALETDIVGGKHSSIDTLWVVKNGIHGPDVEDMGGYDEGGVEETLWKFNKRKGCTKSDLVRPLYVVPTFRW